MNGFVIFKLGCLKLFATVNHGLSNINRWFLNSKLSFNDTKTNYSFFHKIS